jgi:hypothetical protein
LKQSHSIRTKRRPIAIINRNHVLIRLPPSRPADGVFGSDSYVHQDGSWAEMLERAIEASDRVRLNGAGSNAKVIEHQPQPKVRRI